MNRFLFVLLLAVASSCGNNDATPTATKSPGTQDSSPVTTSPATNQNSNEKVSLSTTELERQFAMVSSDPALAYDLAYAYAEEKNSKALRLADSLIKTKTPELEKAYYSKAEYYSRTGNIPEAVKAYDNAIAANLYFLDAHIDKGQLLFNEKRYNDALKAFAIGQKLSVSEPLFYLWIAKTQEAMGDRKNAKENYERAFALDKTLTEARSAAERL